MIVDLIARKLERAYKRKCGSISKSERSYAIGDHTIFLPTDHLLPVYQSENRLYDRFPLSLAQLTFDGWVLDIGANVGDTAAAFLSGSRKKILCIEPIKSFYALLQKNADVLRRNGSTIVCVNTAVGAEGGSVSFDTSSSTASVGKEGPVVGLRSLDNIVSEMIPPGDCVSLVKCDVDGFDAEVLRSGEKTIAEGHPLIYFEAEVLSKANWAAVRNLCEWLNNNGYYTFTLFDNFGLPLVENATPNVVYDALRYVYWQNEKLSTRTIWYCDILASTQKYKPQHVEALSHYKRTWLETR